MSKILYVASNMTHINNFHRDYIAALREAGHTVSVMARGEGADYDIPFEKKLYLLLFSFFHIFFLHFENQHLQNSYQQK